MSKNMGRLLADAEYLGRCDQTDSGSVIWDRDGFRAKTRALLHGPHLPENESALYNAYRKGVERGRVDQELAEPKEPGGAANPQSPGPRYRRWAPYQTRTQDVVLPMPRKQVGKAEQVARLKAARALARQQAEYRDGCDYSVDEDWNPLG